MIVYRVAKKQYAEDLTGEGARLHGGRWNHPMTPCLYASESRALAILEYSVNVQLVLMPLVIMLVSIEIPTEHLMTIRRDRMPRDWNAVPAPESTKNMGTLILNDSNVPVFGVPSSIVPEEWNYVINPRVLLPHLIRIADTREFAYDFRIKQ